MTTDRISYTGLLALTFLAVVVVLIVYVATVLPEWAVTVWAVLATLLLVPVAVLSWSFGKRDARLTTSGMHIGMSTVMDAADQATQFRGRAGYADARHRTNQDRRFTQDVEELPPATLLAPSNSTEEDILDL